MRRFFFLLCAARCAPSFPSAASKLVVSDARATDQYFP
jgi:hypothetical protein